MNHNELKQVIPVLQKQRIVPLIVGDKGIGKSECIKQIATAQGASIFDFRTGICGDAADIRGLPFKLSDENGNPISTGFLPPNELPRGGKGIFFIDEINRGNKEVTQALFQLVLDRQVGEYTLPDGWDIVAAMNPPTEDYNVNDFNDAALTDRFCQIKLEPTIDGWAENAKSRGISSTYINWIKQNPMFLNQKLTDFKVEGTPSSRANTRFALLEDECIKANIPEHLIKELGFGMIGVAATGSYYAYKEDNQNKPFAALDILNNFSKIKDKVVEYSSSDKNRNDILQISNDLLAEYLAENVITKEQENNFVEYYCAIPNDLAYAFFKKELMLNPKVKENLIKVHSSIDESIYGSYDTVTHKNPNTQKMMDKFVDIQEIIKRLNEKKEE